MQEGRKCLHGAGKKRQIAFRESKVMKFGKAGTGIAAAAAALSMLSSMPVFASSELNFGAGFTPQTVTETQSFMGSDWTETYDLHSYNQSPELYFTGMTTSLYNNVYYPTNDGGSSKQAVKTNKSGLVTKIVLKQAGGEGGAYTETTTYKYNKKGDLLSMNVKVVLADGNVVASERTVTFHYNKDYTLNYISGNSFNYPEGTMICRPARDESGKIVGFSRVDAGDSETQTTDSSFTFNPDGTIASMTETSQTVDTDGDYVVNPFTNVTSFVYENGRLAAYQEVSDYPVTYVFDY